MNGTKKDFQQAITGLINEDKQDLSISNNLILSSITLLSVILIVYGQLNLSNIIVKILLILNVICSLVAIYKLQVLYNIQNKWNVLYQKLEKITSETKTNWNQIIELIDNIENKKQEIADYSRCYWRISTFNLYTIGFLIIFNTIIQGVERWQPQLQVFLNLH